MSKQIGQRPAMANPVTYTKPGTRDSVVSASPRPSQSQNPQEAYVLETIYPSDGTAIVSNVDIIAVHGLSQKGEISWVFNRSKGPSTKKDSFKPAVESIKETKDAAANFVGILGKKAAKPFSIPVQRAQADLPLTKEPKEKASAIQPSDASISSDTVDLNPSLPTKVNWLKDESMLPKSLPRARVLQFNYTSSPTGTPAEILRKIASELLERLSEARKNCGPGLSRPLVFIGHGFGGIVISQALIMAHEESHQSILEATVGLLFLGTPFQGSQAVVDQLQAKHEQQ
ncbi:alpha/beta-Hydrolase [Glarea lozoyensis ATCC 20868]|uniref:Alpha/beta-Hydrolase n=1 Tax=Glarea lozoyensis (strain ATCC 20868 / MF5171) TaxID=1116229 RepID=S3D4I2_GLAL2|nr:alpha/beta-Hydrolase [Glarea lozoyensis ATCC 20868]EPE32024.1 alpha/beta-Hydrolase [Glarea lozoyensis ATCC 20868]